MAARDGGGMGHRGCIVAIDVQQARAGDLIVGDLAGVDAQAVVAPPQDRPLAGRSIDDDVSRLVGAALPQLYVVQVDAGGAQAFHLDAAALIVAHGAYIFRPQPQPRARHHGAGNLSAGAHHFRIERHLAGIGRKVRHHQQRIGGIEAHAHHVEFRHR